METPQDYLYTKEHEWAKVEDDIIIVGITDYAQGELGDIVFVELPEIGMEVDRGGAFGTIEAVKAVSDLYSPATGVIVDVNGALEDSPELVNHAPFEDGWMVKIQFTDKNEIDELMSADQYIKFVEAL